MININLMLTRFESLMGYRTNRTNLRSISSSSDGFRRIRTFRFDIFLLDVIYFSDMSKP